MPLLALVALAACERKAAAPPPGAQPPAPVKPAVSVLNADILVIDGVHLRLSNAAAPQPVPDARCWGEALAAKQATLAVATMVNRAAAVTSQSSGKVDDYDRKLATVQIDGADLGDLLFNQGLAARPQSARFDWCAPVSRADPGAPPITALLDLSPIRAPAR